MKEKIMEYLTLNRGLEIDLDEGWRKIISRQFGGSPGRGMKELIQNLIDSYPADTPWEKRKGEILTGSDWIRIVDHGSGLDRNKLRLLVTLGGTDKDSDPDKIGTFGMGFFSIFNPRLKTRSVKVTTKCEDRIVELGFDVREPEKIPHLTCTVKQGEIPFSTRIEVHFGSPVSVMRCLEAAEEALKYYPCNISINGTPFQSIWVKAGKSGAFEFSSDVVRGFVEKAGLWSGVNLLCKYEHLMMLSVNEFLTGGRGMSRDLDDHVTDRMPFLPGVRIYVNCNSLNVTISRDSFYLDHRWRSMKTEVSRLLMDYLEKFLAWNRDPSYVLANQYIFRNEIGDFLKGKGKQHPAVAALARAQIYSLAGKRGKVSLEDIRKSLSPETPLFFSTTRVNIRWVGGN
ncbi:hypothetical protein JW906_14370, partial [bacterium]|nr:hypothetical protein [bacterium]